MQSVSASSFMWIAFGVAALVVALALAGVLIRLRGTLGAVEALLETTNEEMKETLPEVRQTIENVNALRGITSAAVAGSGPTHRGRCDVDVTEARKALTAVTRDKWLPAR